MISQKDDVRFPSVSQFHCTDVL